MESWVRMMMERAYAGVMEHTQNDHYLYRIESKERKYAQAQEFADAALSFAMQACEMVGIKYRVGTKAYKRG